ncbi:class I SAM-dependent methyltransferase [Novosphingobium piscinae]|uniref:Class I SAM-dependent methyltransferase n=1 Tax=Novosphingobium piscinae TaxID=1507448 RepID=A0A7X1G1I7_9SPHN|nr:class I SAM-dependent methyltransferase [Novosphingobium piscinae]MBC2670900.1 class I SAM-dependent methyltransferase [Novosphingobium piscinae]
MKIDRKLMTDFVARYPAQPATAFLRGIEIDVLARAAIPDGLGLDLGCGDGILTDILFNRIGRRPDLVGIDPDPLETDAAKSYDFYRRIHTCGGDAIPEPDATFDYAISNSVLEHIPDLEPVIAELARVLKPGGTFFFTVPGPGFRENLRGSVIPGVPRTRYLAEIDRRLAHFHYLSEAEWRALCERNGLQVTGVTGYLGQRATRRWETLSRMTGGLLHSLTGGTLRPIEIQRSLKLRALQNTTMIPRPVASTLAGVIGAGLGWSDDAASPGCLLVTGRRLSAT